ncbi:hypothetical protein Sjap_010853 [Stephania japonica]|uniref:Integrator complex subunit 7 n=1 Tax=Stephania japonica TaxID=461633 RepID=A0AAP0JC88_9MAGN
MGLGMVIVLGAQIEAIVKIGSRLVEWNEEPCSALVTIDMFGLVPNEDKLFANAILLRLSDAFRTGDKHTKISILKIFLLEHRHRTKKGKRYRGIFAREGVPNYKEMLRRVKTVFDMGDVESRALALRLLGCWADIAKDNADIRYMILSSLGSCHVLETFTNDCKEAIGARREGFPPVEGVVMDEGETLMFLEHCIETLDEANGITDLVLEAMKLLVEVKASMFAAGRFSELSDDFASIFLEALVNIITSSKTSSTIKLAGARAFAKLNSSSILTSRAYKSGRKLVDNCSEEKFLIELLIALSKLASKSICLIHEQVDLLLSFITEKHALCVHVVVFQCLSFLLAGGICRSSLNVDMIKRLFHTINTNFPAMTQNGGALHILRKVIYAPIFQSMQCGLSHMEESERLKLVSDVEKAAKSSNKITRFLGLQLLVDVSCNNRMSTEAVHYGDGSVPLSSHILMLLGNHIVELVKTSVTDRETWSKVMEECRSLLKLVLRVVEEYPTVGVVALNRILHSIKTFTEDCKEAIGARKQGSPPVQGVVTDEGETLACFAVKLASCIYRFLEHCIETLDDANGMTVQVLEVMKLYVEVINQSNVFSYGVCVRYSLLLLSWGMWICSENENNEIHIHNHYWIEHQRLSLSFAEKIGDQNNWAAYAAGKSAACQGGWFAAAFTFRKLMDKVQSDVCHYWLRSLALIARSECTILLLFPEQGCDILNMLHISDVRVKSPLASNAIGQHDSWNGNSVDIGDNLNKACNDVRSAADTLAAVSTIDKTFVFQRWFLILRSKVLETVSDMHKLLSFYNLGKESLGCNNLQACGNTMVCILELDNHYHSLLYFLSRILLQLRALVRKYDLLASSFIGMDKRSFRIIARLALHCSLLAFCTGFVLYCPGPHTHKQSEYSNIEEVNESLLSMLIHDLAERLRHMDDDISTNLRRHGLLLFGQPNSCFHVSHRALLDKAGCKEKVTLDVCRFALSGFLTIQEGEKQMNGKVVLPHYYRTRLQLLSNVLKKWIGISFQVPRYFFEVGPCVGAELFVFDSNSRSDEMSIFPGFHLSLKLCLQLKNAPQIKVRRLYCILASKSSYQVAKHAAEVKEQVCSTFQACEDDDAVDLNEKLLTKVTKNADITSRKRARYSTNDGFVWSCVEFEPNERMQGLSTCLLDVSTFPVGSYQIKWLGGCIDSRGSYWSLLPLNLIPVFNVKKPPDNV